MSALFTFSGIAVIAILPPSLGWAVLSSVLLVIGYALDAADGQLARLQGSGSRAGESLDHTVDALKTSVLHLAILTSRFRFDDDQAVAAARADGVPGDRHRAVSSFLLID